MCKDTRTKAGENVGKEYSMKLGLQKGRSRDIVQNHQVILNLIQDRILNIKEVRSRIKYGMTSLFNNGGFTLIELLVGVLIIGILAAVALPQYQKAVDKSKYQTIAAVMRTIVKAEKLYKLEYGTYTLNWKELFSTGIVIPYTSINNAGYLLTSGSDTYSLSNEGTYPHVFYNGIVLIYAAFPAEDWLCYPRGTTRGKTICKNLGCATDKLDNQYCSFKPS